MKEYQNSDRERQTERQHDLDWIAENGDLFWLTATVACEQVGRGMIVVDTISQTEHGGHPFSYIPQGEIEEQGETLSRLIQKYNPHREYLVMLLKPNGRKNIYVGALPEMGWWAAMETKTAYPLPDYPQLETDFTPLPEWQDIVFKTQNDKSPKPLFEGGSVLATQDALNALQDAKIEGTELLARHLLGDWGDVKEIEKKLNDEAILYDELVRSVYQLRTGTEIWVTTERDREATYFELSYEAEARDKKIQLTGSHCHT